MGIALAVVPRSRWDHRLSFGLAVRGSEGTNSEDACYYDGRCVFSSLSLRGQADLRATAGSWRRANAHIGARAGPSTLWSSGGGRPDRGVGALIEGIAGVGAGMGVVNLCVSVTATADTESTLSRTGLAVRLEFPH